METKKELVLTDAEVKSISRLTNDTFEIWLSPEKDFPEPAPFQFVTLYLDGFELRRPFSVAGFKNGSLRVVFKVKGRMTKELSRLKIGAKLSVLGPLGSKFNYFSYGRILAVAGGVGIAPFLYFFEKEASERSISLIYGVKTVDDAWFEDIYTDLKGFLLVTEDGSSNYHGYPVDYIMRVASYFQPEAVIAVGPLAMLRSLKPAKIQMEIPFFVSLEPYMGCALGACGSCLVKLKNGEFAKACIKGPIFNMDELDLEG